MQLGELHKNNNELIFSVCDGDPLRMNELRKFNVFDFYQFINNFSKKNST